MGNKQKKRKPFPNIEKDYKLQLLIFVVLSVIIIIAYIVADNVTDKQFHRKYTIVDDIKVVKEVEDITVDSDKIIIEGYAFMSDKNSSDDLISVFLRNVITKEEIWLDMEQIERPDVNSYFEGKFDYINTGFIASTASKRPDNNEVYEIIINIDYIDANEDAIVERRRTVLTDSYILDGVLYAYNPNEFDKPDMNVESELLKEVFKNGSLCFYREDEGMYVYQYDHNLYWIANEEFTFEEDGSTHIPYQLYTSQINKLPEDRMQYGYDALGFDFEKNKYMNESTSPYRVVIKEIPEEYPIIYVRTGVYDTDLKKTLWSERFQLNHDFK